MVQQLEIHRCPNCGTQLAREPWAAGLCPQCMMSMAVEDTALEVDQAIGSDAVPTLQFDVGSLHEGQILENRYRVRSLLGRGGMGEVWRSFDLKLRVDVALKALRQELLQDRRALEALRQEVRTAREVISPNVCRVFDLVELEGQELVSMEYIDGITLADILKMRAPLELTEAREIASQFLAGLEAIHEAGLIHRDMKPENIMMTRSGRVVVMDFGIAKGLADRKTGTISGTPAYMAPEQARGESANARADVFSSGVILVEMIAPNGLARHEHRAALWEGIHKEPPEVPDSAWAPVLKKAVAGRAEQRYATASALARALEEVTLRVEDTEQFRPYPGLASFSQEDAEYFFGRELEVEEMWKKLRRPHLLGLIGPSGAGKSSFLRAGLLPVIPTGWRAVVAAPGNRPFMALGEALVSEFSGDDEAMKRILRFEESEEAVGLVTEWRQRHDQVLIILDQFEELFTQNPPEVQTRFGEFLGRLALEADAHVLVSMRDDFLYHCHSHESLHPILSELTLLGPPTGGALRRAVVQPALKCGYRFEDDALVEEMVGEVGDERGALPMLAFAAARLWDHRDREQGLLTREAYEHVGGVGGALAQHAEATLEKIGQDHVPIVRELFRNLVTAQGTRVARDRAELLSVFGDDGGLDSDVGEGLAPSREGTRPSPASDRKAADAVLSTLIDARLLTSYEVAGADDEDTPRNRIEIIHESLLSNWPRLVRWQTQDADSAQLRDQIRQAAQMWEERGRPEDLLWTGTSFGEYRLWRERYEGGVSAQEEEFAAAMVAKAERAKRRRRMVLAAVIAVLAVGLSVMGALWWQAEKSRQRAEAETLRAEASKLLALGRLELETNPTAALAYVRKSLELADSSGGRRFALEIMWRGPVARVLTTPAASIAFSADGESMAVGGAWGLKTETTLFSAAGQRSLVLDGGEEAVSGWLAFAPDGKMLVGHGFSQAEGGAFVSRIDRWILPEGRQLSPIQWDEGFEDGVEGKLGPGGLLTFTWHRPEVQFDFWPTDQLNSESPQSQPLGVWSRGGYGPAWDVDPGLTRVAWRSGEGGEEVSVRSLDFSGSSDERVIGRHQGPVEKLTLSTDGRLLASRTQSELKVWSFEQGDDPLVAQLEGLEKPEHVCPPLFDPRGSRIAQVSMALQSAFVWDLQVPLDSEPLVLARKGREVILGAFHPSGQWLATTHYQDVAFWPQEWPYARSLDPGMDPGFNWVRGLAFSPDSKWLASCSGWTAPHLWPMEAGLGPDRILGATGCLTPAFDPQGEHLLVSSARPPVAIVPVAGGEPRVLPESGLVPGTIRLISAVAFDSLGRRAAAAVSGEFGAEEDRVLRIWDLDSDEEQVLDLLQDCREPGEGSKGGCGVSALRFTPDGSLYTAGRQGVRRWDLESERSEWLHQASERSFWALDVSADGRFLVTIAAQFEEGQVLASEFLFFDLVEGTYRTIDGRGEKPSAVAFDASGQILLSGDSEGTVYVGPAAGGQPHLLLGHDSEIVAVDLSPDGRWIASASAGEIRVWPMPDLDKTPFHTLPHDELLAKLHSFTNVQAVEDLESSTGWKLGVGPFPGWQEVPEW